MGSVTKMGAIKKLQDWKQVQKWLQWKKKYNEWILVLILFLVWLNMGVEKQYRWKRVQKTVWILAQKMGVEKAVWLKTSVKQML